MAVDHEEHGTMGDLLCDLAPVLIRRVDMGFKSHGIVFENKEKQADLSQLLITDCDSRLLLQLSVGTLLYSLARLDFTPKAMDVKTGSVLLLVYKSCIDIGRSVPLTHSTGELQILASCSQGGSVSVFSVYSGTNTLLSVF